jgi:hypothetical protein
MTSKARQIADYVLGLFTDRATGNVGINTTSPNTQLEVAGNIHVSGADRSIFNRSNNALTLGTNNTERVRITDAGNVGIGTSSPAQQLHSTGGQIFGQNKKLSFTGDFTATATPKINLTLNSTSTPRLSCFIYLFGRDFVNSLSVATTILSVSVGSTARNVSVVNSTGQNNVASASIALSGNDLVITLTVNAVSPSTVGYTNMRGYVDIIEDNQSITAVSVSG